MTEQQQGREKLYCNSCRQITNHEPRGSHRAYTELDEEGLEFEESVSRLLVCAGCETATLEVRQTADWMLDDYGEQLYETYYYPKRASRDLVPKRFVKWSRTLEAGSVLGPKLSRIYKETINAYNDGSLVLCSAGLRALLEGVCDDKRIRGRNLIEKIDALQALLPNKNIIKRLHHFRFTGNKALHKLEGPQAVDVKLAIEVMEDLLTFLYELDYKASRLGRRPKKIRITTPIPAPAPSNPKDDEASGTPQMEPQG